MFYPQKKKIFQNLMPNRCYFNTMALDLIFGPKCLLTQILEYHVFTKIFHCASSQSTARDPGTPGPRDSGTPSSFIHHRSLVCATKARALR